MHCYENECVDCGLPCIYESCKYWRVLRFYCDHCQDECEKLYYWGNEELCLDCIEKELEAVEGDDDY